MTSGDKTASCLKHSNRKSRLKMLLAVAFLLCGAGLPNPFEKDFCRRPVFNCLESSPTVATAVAQSVADLAATGLLLTSPTQAFAQERPGRDKRLAADEIRRIEDERFYRLCVTVVALVVFLLVGALSVKRYLKWKRKKARRAKRKAMQHGTQE